MIIGEMRRYLRDYNTIRVSRSVRDLAYKAIAARERLSNEKQSEVTNEEIAKVLGVDKKDIDTALDAISDPISLFDHGNVNHGNVMTQTFAGMTFQYGYTIDWIRK